MAGVTLYPWFPPEEEAKNLSSLPMQEIIYYDMLRYVVGGAFGGKATQVKNRPLGDVINLDYIIELELPEIAESENYSHNADKAKQIFLVGLEKIKKASLYDSLIAMEYGEVGMSILGKFEDITLGQSGNKLSEFKMIEFESTDDTMQILSNRYEESLEEFLSVDYQLDIINFQHSVDEFKPKTRSENNVSFDFTLEYNETVDDNTEKLTELGLDSPKFEPKGSTSNMEDSLEVDAARILLLNNQDNLKEFIMKEIYDNIKKERKSREYKNVILNPRYVTTMSIKGKYFGIMINVPLKTSDNKLSYSGKIETTHEMPSELLTPQTTSAIKPAKKKKKGELSRFQLHERSEARTELIQEIKGRIKRLEQAIRGLS